MGFISFFRFSFTAGLASLFLFATGSSAFASGGLPLKQPVAERAVDAHLARDATERLLGSDREEDAARACLPYTREMVVGGFVYGSIVSSAIDVGLPAATMLETWRAFGFALDLERDVRDGDRFHVRYEQSFTGDGHPIGVGRVLWAELRTAAKGTVAIHRFRTKDASRNSDERFWFSNGSMMGQAAAQAVFRVPLDTLKITSGFGMRADPFDKVMGTASAIGPLPESTKETAAVETPAAAPAEEAKPVRRAMRGGLSFSGFGGGASGGSSGASRDVLESRGADHDRTVAARETRERAEAEKKSEPQPDTQVAAATPKRMARLFMHEGVDLVANPGTPVYAAADGIVFGAQMNGRYGNWIQVDHAGKLSTVYGHLSGYAPGLVAGARVSQGDVIGFVGNTGHSTGAHLHFEVLNNGRAVDPLARAEMSRAQLRGADLERFRRQVKAQLAERDQEAAAVLSQVHR